MDAIVKLISEKAGKTEDDTRAVISALIEYFKSTLPKPILEFIEDVISKTPNK
ncbi:MAG: hypothetical protein OZ913_05975 [Ignavibacteriaceae bacterium]|jgi:hypothetical protein|nr:MAG: hypothetical protein UZ04_CHB001001847 [Chlorobi bacterium OLB4]MBV6398144.1 hypothetical protein [Ignavibacteria bacterium]MBW7856085.1 hypothetical protein [Ignavibacteria bacterium]MCC6886593.1 hypothetical protein [Ignavibacteriales bacterium]MEB2329833.1 hypothetical protein [Ignavibacteriaceae bacterium]